jgi:hypothetical protein
MKRFDFHFKRTGKFVMEGSVSVDLDTDKRKVPLSELEPALRDKLFSEFLQKSIQFSEDSWTFIPEQKDSRDVPKIVEHTS